MIFAEPRRSLRADPGHDDAPEQQPAAMTFEVIEVGRDVDYFILTPAQVEAIPPAERPPLIPEKYRRAFLARYLVGEDVPRARPPLTGGTVINGFEVALSVIPPGHALPTASADKGRSVVLVPMSEGHTLVIRETGPSRDQVEHWERIERGDQFRRLGCSIDRTTGEVIGGPEWMDRKGGGH